MILTISPFLVSLSEAIVLTFSKPVVADNVGSFAVSRFFMSGSFMIFSVNFWYVLLLVILLVSIMVLGKLTWSFALNREVDKKIRQLHQKFTEEGDGFNYAEKEDYDEDFFSPEAIAFIKQRHDDPSGIAVREGAEFLKQSKNADSESRYRDFAQMLPDIVFETDIEGNLLFVNRTGFHILGISPEVLKQKKLTAFDFVDPRDVQKARENFERIINNRRSEDSEYRIVDGQKVVMTVLSYALPVVRKGQVIGIRGLLVDISQRKKNEETIRTLKDIVSHVGLGINVFRLEASRESQRFILEMVNVASEKLMRFSKPENIGKSLNEISPLFRKQNLQEYLERALVSNEAVELDDFIYQPDPTVKAKILSLKIFPLPQNRVVLLMEDISARKETEQKSQMTSFGLEHAGDIVFWVEENARFLFANETACQNYGYSRDELLEMTVTDVDSRVTMMQWYELIQILEKKPSLTMESIHKKRTGETFPVEISINKFVFDDKAYFFAFVRDISERKKYDELEQNIQVARKSAALKQQFLANMSHEIRTPMTGIMGMTSLLMRTSLSPAQQEYVRNIKISSENLLNIINDVLDLSKIEAGKMELKPNRISFGELVDEVHEMFQHQARNKGIRFTTSIDPLIPANIIVDDQRLKQVLNNLLSNALKFTDDGVISVDFGVEYKREKELLLYCRVKDTGMGIGEANQKQIFEKFTQIDTSLIRPFEGTGLGLAICSELTQLMGGEISVSSELGKGSTFTFTFKADYDKSDNEPFAAAQVRDFNELKLNVLHVEDKLLNQKVVGFILLNAGCNVDFVKNGQEAIDLYVPGRYDVILMDIQMPVMDGISAYKELKRLYGNRLCPVIGLSANALEGDAQKYIAQGLDDYIVKPFPPNVLYEKLSKWAGKLNSQGLK
ncbi:MAG: PAS domain S-box protein [Bacteroidetes bacterium]|nr:MAG: PAS domain S-box protein [Bacteroidota bacterium]